MSLAVGRVGVRRPWDVGERDKGADLTAAGDLTRFPDGEEVSAWARTAMAWANGKGLVNGNEDGTLAPLSTTNRAQAASIMAKYDQLIGK